MKKVYLILCDVGLLVPLILVGLFMRDHGWNPALFWQQMWGGYIASTFTADLLLSCVVFWIWMFREARKRQITRPWLYVVLTLMVGLCFALPLFLYVREGKSEVATGATPTAGRVALGNA